MDSIDKRMTRTKGSKRRENKPSSRTDKGLNHNGNKKINLRRIQDWPITESHQRKSGTVQVIFLIVFSSLFIAFYNLVYRIVSLSKVKTSVIDGYKIGEN